MPIFLLYPIGQIANILPIPPSKDPVSAVLGQNSKAKNAAYYLSRGSIAFYGACSTLGEKKVYFSLLPRGKQKNNTDNQTASSGYECRTSHKQLPERRIQITDAQER